MANGDGNGNGNGNGYGNGASGKWQWFMSITTAAAIVAGAALTFFVQNATLSTTVTMDSARIVALERSVGETNEHNTVLRADAAATEAKIKELEAKFCSSDTVRNLMHAYDLRMISMLWHSQNPSMPFPTDNAYYPLICK